jgi:hypothetical protein
LRPLFALTAAAAAAATTAATCSAGPPPKARWPIPDRLYAEALCVHSGWVYEAARSRPERRRLLRRLGHGPDYFNGGTAFYRVRQVGNGEGGWSTVNSYGGGMQMTLGTYNRAVARSHGRLRPASSNADVAQMTAAEQIYAAVLIVQEDGGSWREWPMTSRACGFR